MSKFVNVANGNYKLTVQPGGTITMDTGVASGQFIVTGDLTVQGATTFVSSTNIDIKDNIITCLLYTSPSPRDRTRSRMPSSA